MSRRRAVLVIAGVTVLLAGGYFSTGAPRMTLLNAAIRIRYPLSQGAALLGAAAGVALLGAAARRGLRFAFGVVVAGAVLLAVERLLYRLDAGSDGLVSRGLFGETTVPWRDITRVQQGPALIVIWGRGDAQVRIDTSDFRPDHRATLERTIARRVQEAAEAGQSH